MCENLCFPLAHSDFVIRFKRLHMKGTTQPGTDEKKIDNWSFDTEI